MCPYKPAIVSLMLDILPHCNQKTPSMLFSNQPSCPGQSGATRGFILRTELIIDKQGFASAWFGRRTRSFGRGGSRMGWSFVLVPFGGIANRVRGRPIGQSFLPSLKFNPKARRRLSISIARFWSGVQCSIRSRTSSTISKLRHSETSHFSATHPDSPKQSL